MKRFTLLAVLALAACHSEQQSGVAASHRKAPETVVAQAQRLPTKLFFPGTIVAAHDTLISSSRGGRVESYLVDVGQQVRRGDVLMRLEAGELSFASAAAAAGASQVATRMSGATDASQMPAVIAARAELDAARDATNRAEALFKQGSLSNQELQRSRTELSTAEAKLKTTQAEANAEFVRLREVQALAGQARAALGEAVLRAPFDGVVLERFVDVGQLAAPNASLLRLVDIASLRVRFHVGQLDSAHVKQGSTALVLVNNVSIAAHVARTAPGFVSEGNSRLVEAEFDAALEHPPLPGALVPTWVDTEHTEDLVVIDRSSTTQLAGVTRAWVVSENRLVERLLSVARIEGDTVFVRSGLRAGERIVKAPQRDFRLEEEVSP